MFLGLLLSSYYNNNFSRILIRLFYRFSSYITSSPTVNVVMFLTLPVNSFTRLRFFHKVRILLSEEVFVASTWAIFPGQPLVVGLLALSINKWARGSKFVTYIFVSQVKNSKLWGPIKSWAVIKALWPKRIPILFTQYFCTGLVVPSTSVHAWWYHKQSNPLLWRHH